MNPRLTIVLIGIVVLPLVIVGWLVGRTVRNERAIAEQQFRELAGFRLDDIRNRLDEILDTARAEITAALEPRPLTVEECRRWVDASLLAKQLYVLDSQRTLIYPSLADPTQRTPAETESLRRIEMVWDNGALAAAIFSAPEGSSPSARSTGWFTWYWGGGVQWIVWHRTSDAVYAVELDRARMISDIINGLPDTVIGGNTLPDGQIRLKDSSDRTIYQWGQFEAAEQNPPVVRLAAGPPLSSWALEYHAASIVGAGGASSAGLLLGVIAIVIAVGLLAIYLHREQTRSLREAGQRVSFVNQVSHELKTPLTNIRMYAELMSDDAGEQNTDANRRLDVIVAESQRLSRLINNVLTLAGEQANPIDLHRKPTVIDTVVRNVLESFRPALQAKSIETELRLDAARPISADPDRLEQIVGNLVSNVEKYGAGGHYLGVRTRIVDGVAELSIEDRGGGIPATHARRIFEPFYRVDGSLAEGVSGTGIGLSISRDLARLHGGELRYESTGAGSRFCLNLPVKAEQP